MELELRGNELVTGKESTFFNAISIASIAGLFCFVLMLFLFLFLFLICEAILIFGLD